jgi:Raf kinase inhibitor-like YbhB/YbcL family protein
MRALALILALGVPLAACGGDQKLERNVPAAPLTIELSSPAFADGATIPRGYTCSGAGARPVLRWSGVPSRARELALVVTDPDAGAVFVHWTAWGIPPRTRSLGPRGLPAGWHEGVTSAGGHGWTPPCPPPGAKPHHYVFSLYWLRAPSGLRPGAPGDEVVTAVGAQAGGRGRLVGRFGR